MPFDDRVAIVGIGGLFPGAHGLDGFWNNLAAGVDGSRDVPPGRWTIPPERAYDPRPAFADHVVSTRGYFLDPFEPDLTGLSIDRSRVEELDVLFHLALHAGNQAFRDARMGAVDRSRVGVILGAIALPTERISELGRELLLHGRSSIDPLNRHVTGLPAVLLAQALGLGGTAFTLDAACASSLYAIKLAVDELRSGRADAMLAGGLSRPDPLYTQMGFSQLRALSPSGRCSPFDTAADGLVVGEGAGIFVLKRLDDALAHGDHIHGVITGIGLANDLEGSLLAPASEGQLRAMRAAYHQAGWRPGDVDFIECHATGTPTGDAVEFRSLLELGRSRENRCVIGSVKSTVGHLLTGANAAGLMKVLLALRHEILPPQANFANEAKEVQLEQSPYRILNRAMPWERRDGVTPRRAAISGFGFGGINAHLLVEEWRGEEDKETRRQGDRESLSVLPKIVIVGAAVQVGELDSLERFADQVLGDATNSSGQIIDEVSIPAGVYPIPPREMEEALPQQMLMLRVAGEALGDAAKKDNERTGVFIGVNLDWNTTNYHTRWHQSVQGMASDEPIPALTANRTMGALASIAASRIARSFHCGGPSFTVSSAETSGLHALAIAADLLRQGEIDRALVGAVDFASDSRQLLLADPSNESGSDGAVALYLKRWEDALRDGDEILAVLADLERQGDKGTRRQGDGKGLSDPPSLPVSLSPRLLQIGAAEGLAAVARAGMALKRRVRIEGTNPRQYWLIDSAEGSRTARVAVEGLFGRSMTVALEEAPPSENAWEGPIPETSLFLLAGRSTEELRGRVRRLIAFLNEHPDRSLFDLAREWWNTQPVDPNDRHRLAIKGDAFGSLLGDLEATLRGDDRPNALARTTVPEPIGRIAFVYPGSGNHFQDMGRELGLLFPRILDRQQAENAWLRSQYAADEFWNGTPKGSAHPRTILFAQVSCGTLVTDVLRSFAIEPQAVLGYSLGESASLFGMRRWRDRDLMLHRLQESTLFASDLAAPFNAARAQWGWPADRQIDWITGVLAISADAVVEAHEPGRKAYLLIQNSANECVIGGQRADVLDLVSRLGAPFLEVAGVTTAHCEAALPVKVAYRALHHLPVSPLPGTTFYSGSWGRPYEVHSDSAADSITDGVLHPIDFRRVVETAYADGVRTFIEIGPGASCCRMIDAILADRPHLALPVLVRQQGPLEPLLNLLSELHGIGVSVDLSPFFDRVSEETRRQGDKETRRQIILPTPRPIVSLPPCPSLSLSPCLLVSPSPFVAVAANYAEVAAAHEAFLRFSTATQDRMAETIALQTQLLQEWTVQGSGTLLVAEEEPEPGVPRSLSPEQCREFAAGSVARALGPLFAEADNFPTRVRLPDGPLLLVDRILAIEGEPLSLTSGRVVTDHFVHEDRWYLDAGRIPTCVAVEAGQADLFLSGYLGIDFHTRGLAVYRLLDAAITFHGPLPGIGERIEYDIHIDSFFRQGETQLFRFRFEGTVDGRPLLSMSEGCAGFFSAEELASGKGIVQTALDRRPMTGKMPSDWQPYVPLKHLTLDATQVDALRVGDPARAFGSAFARLSLREPMRLPDGMLRLVDRVTRLDPTGGRFGIGLIRAEADIHPDDWFLTCHFVDDMVMPGTLMYECCLHTLRIYLMRLGWIGEEGEVACEPVPGIASKLKCRGQVIASTKTVAYEVTLKEIGFGPEPFAIADALMYADGRPIVEMTNMSLRLSGLDREKLDHIWSQSSEKPRILFDRERITAFAIGNPSEAFGEPYRVFDSERVIARLPGPPFQFLDRIMRIEAEPWKMVAGGVIDAEYDVPPEEWYFAAQRAPSMPFSVLLEIALQPCGWLAAYVGSALTSPTDVSFRNLGGKAIQHLPVGPEIGTLTITVKLTRVSNSGGMIIQHYDYAVRSQGRDVYTGDTYFGFFSKEALTNQVGMKEFGLYQPTNLCWNGPFPRESPFPGSMLRMVDTISWYDKEGGPHGLGAIEGRIAVDPGAWFFKAHFHQDPVWPGSLGLESFAQLLRFMGADRWNVPANEVRCPALGREHRWTYRGQVAPRDQEVTVQALVTAVEETSFTAEGLLSVDGRIIYRMTDFVVQR